MLEEDLLEMEIYALQIAQCASSPDGLSRIEIVVQIDVFDISFEAYRVSFFSLRGKFVSAPLNAVVRNAF